MRVFLISFSWWFFTGVWVSASLLKSRTLLSILAVLRYVIVLMVSTRLPTSKSSSPIDNLLVTVPKAPIMIGKIVTFMFHNFFNSLARSRYLFFFSLFFQFHSVVNRDIKVNNFGSSLFLLIIIRSVPLAKISSSECMSNSNRSLCVSFSRTDAGLCIYHLFVWSNLNFLQMSQWIILPIQHCLILYSFYANLMHSPIMWLIVSYPSPHNLHLLFCCVLSILALI